MLVGIKLVTCQLTMGHTTDGMDKVPTVKIFEPVLVRVMSVGPTMEIGRRRVLNPVLITSILQNNQAHVIRNKGNHLHGTPLR